MPPRDRLADLQAMSEKTPHKPLVWYGLAMEQRSRGLRAEAVRAFEKCTEVDPAYVAAYFQWAMTMDELAQRPRAVELLRRGIEVAHQRGDSHAAGEMQEQLEMWSEE